jgi:hypothetical protein
MDVFAGRGYHGGVKLNSEGAYRGKVVLIANGDDVGAVAEWTDVTLDAYFKGLLSSASILANGHDADRALSWLKTRPDLPIGVHLTLTGDCEPLTPGKSLRNASGRMWDTPDEVGRNVKPEEASVEWEAQIGKVADAGIEVSHLDAHMGCYFQSPGLMRSAFDVAKKYRVPLISPSLPGWKSGNGGLYPVTSYSGLYRLEGKEETLGNRTEAYWKMLDGFPPGVHYIFTHHARPAPGEAGDGDLDIRIHDNLFWTGAETRSLLSKKGFVMIGCGPLKKDFQAALEARS